MFSIKGYQHLTSVVNHPLSAQWKSFMPCSAKALRSWLSLLMRVVLKGRPWVIRNKVFSLSFMPSVHFLPPQRWAKTTRHHPFCNRVSDSVKTHEPRGLLFQMGRAQSIKHNLIKVYAFFFSCLLHSLSFRPFAVMLNWKRVTVFWTGGISSYLYMSEHEDWSGPNKIKKDMGVISGRLMTFIMAFLPYLSCKSRVS